MLSPWGSGPAVQAGGARRPRTERARLAFGGVAFELLAATDGAPPVGLLDAAAGAHCVAPEAAPTCARVTCALQPDRSLPPAVTGDDVWMKPAADGLRLGSRQMEAELRPLGHGRYVARARIAAGPQALQAALRGISAALVEREGGLVLHASGLELDGQAVLLVGPSGAGKSTATELAEAGRCFAYDNVAIFPHASGPVAWGLPGGTAPAAPRSPHVHLPLRAVLRVRRGEGAPRLAACDPASALFVLRESTEAAELSRRGEEARLSAIASLATRVAVGELWTVLGHSITPLLRAKVLGARESL